MYPHERSLVKQLADKPFALIGVNSDRDIKKLRKVLKDKNLTWRSFQNEQDYGRISESWGVRGWPTLYLIDAEGKIRYANIRGKAIDRGIEKLLGEMGHEVTIKQEKEEKPAKKKDDGEETEEKKDDRKDARQD